MPFTGVGDIDQCVLSGEPILTDNGSTPVECIGIGDSILAAVGKSDYGTRIVTGKSCNEGNFIITTITTKLGFNMSVTHNHQCFASIPNISFHTRYNPDMHWIYIMYRYGFGYRVGVTRNPKQRLHGEGGDKLWLVKVCDTRGEAQYWEHVYASRYGLPRLTFVDHNPTRDGSYMDKDLIERFFSEVDTEKAARAFQVGEGFKFDTGAHIMAAGYDPRVILYVTMCKSANTKTPTHTLNMQTSNEETISKMRDIGFNLRSAKKGSRYVKNTQNIVELQNLTSQIQQVTGCEIVVKTNFISSENMENRRMNPVMMPAGNIIPGFMVPILNDGKVILDEVVSVIKKHRQATVYDLEVGGVANFFVGGICIHNTLFRFAGASPSIMSERLPEYFPDLITFKLEINYRSTQEIIRQSVASIAHNYSEKSGPYDQSLFKSVVARHDAEEGTPFSFEMFDTQEDEADHIAQSIEAYASSGEYQWGDFFIGSRTRAQLGFIEGSLTKYGIKYVNLAGGCFWNSKHVANVIAYAQLAHHTDNKEAFKRVYNIASKWFRSKFGASKGKYINHRYLGRSFLESVNDSYLNTDHVIWRYKAGVEDLRNFVKEIQNTLDSSGVAGAISFVVENCYIQWLAADEGLLTIDESQNGKLDDLKTVIDIAGRYEDPDEFFKYVEDMRAAAQDIKNGDHSKYVVISTVHRLKGKERPVVFGIGVCEGVSTGFTKQPCGLLPHTFSLINPPNFGVLPGGGKGRIEDERCVFFVLISRAKERVHLSGMRFFRENIMQPSRFIYEIHLKDEGETNASQ